MSPTQDNSNAYNVSRRAGGEEVGLHPYCTQKHVIDLLYHSFVWYYMFARMIR